MRAGQIDLLHIELPLTLSPASPLSDEDLLRFSEQNEPYRVERNKEGEILVKTPVNYKGGKHEGFIAAALLFWAEEDGRGSAIPANVGFNLPDGSCLAPDAAWITKEREAALTPAELDSFPPICPDFVIEVRSKSDARRVVEAKMQTWLDNGAKLAWLVDPLAENVTIYRPGEEAEQLDRPEIVVATEPIVGFALRCTRLWTTL